MGSRQTSTSRDSKSCHAEKFPKLTLVFTDLKITLDLRLTRDNDSTFMTSQSNQHKLPKFNEPAQALEVQREVLTQSSRRISSKGYYISGYDADSGI